MINSILPKVIKCKTLTDITRQGWLTPPVTGRRLLISAAVVAVHIAETGTSSWAQSTWVTTGIVRANTLVLGVTLEETRKTNKWVLTCIRSVCQRKGWCTHKGQSKRKFVLYSVLYLSNNYWAGNMYSTCGGLGWSTLTDLQALTKRGKLEANRRRRRKGDLILPIADAASEQLGVYPGWAL